MTGFLVCIIAGAAMSVQGVMNTRLGEKIGLYESNAFVAGTAFILSMFAVFLFGKGNFATLSRISKLYWLGGALGLVITLTVMVGINRLSPTIAVSVILVSQLAVAALIDAFGWMGTKTVPFSASKVIGLALMIVGIIVFRHKT